MKQDNQKLGQCVIGLERKKEIGDFVKVIDVIESEPDLSFEDELREKSLEGRRQFSDCEDVRDIRLGGRREFVNLKQARDRYLLNENLEENREM